MKTEPKDPVLLQILACPCCEQEDEYCLPAGQGVQGAVLSCPACGEYFAIQYGTFVIQRFEYRAFPVAFESDKPFTYIDPPRTLS